VEVGSMATRTRDARLIEIKWDEERLGGEMARRSGATKFDEKKRRRRIKKVRLSV
jgi:hypothetical protein